MAEVALIVPVLNNFEGFTRLMATVDRKVLPIIVPNYEDNKGVSYAWNYGLMTAKLKGCEVAVISNDDLTLSPNCIDHMAYAIKNRGLDLASATNDRDYEPAKDEDDMSSDVDYACFAVNPQTFTDKFGEFDEHFFPAYFEDNDMYRRIELAGGMQRKLLYARMYHRGSETQNFNGQQVVTGPMFEANRAYYKAKWGGRPGEETYDRPHNQEHLTYKDC